MTERGVGTPDRRVTSQGAPAAGSGRPRSGRWWHGRLQGGDDPVTGLGRVCPLVRHPVRLPVDREPKGMAPEMVRTMVDADARLLGDGRAGRRIRSDH
jgi:hypothetical protein